jgi:hypothetical protein
MHAKNDATGPRELLYVAQAPCEPLVAYLQSHGWNVSIGRLAAHAPKLLKLGTPTAGIVDMTNYSVRELAALEPALRHQLAGWIALTDETSPSPPCGT